MSLTFKEDPDTAWIDVMEVTRLFNTGQQQEAILIVVGGQFQAQERLRKAIDDGQTIDATMQLARLSFLNGWMTATLLSFLAADTRRDDLVESVEKMVLAFKEMTAAVKAGKAAKDAKG